MQTTTLFQNGSSQAVRIPKAFRFQGKRVNISKAGNNIVLRPITDSWDSFYASLDAFSSDFMQDGRNQPEQQEREGLFG